MPLLLLLLLLLLTLHLSKQDRFGEGLLLLLNVPDSVHHSTLPQTNLQPALNRGSEFDSCVEDQGLGILGSTDPVLEYHTEVSLFPSQLTDPLQRRTDNIMSRLLFL